MTPRPGGPPTGLPDVVGLIEAVRQVGSPLNFLAVLLALMLIFLVSAATLFDLPEWVRILIVLAGVLAPAGLAVAVSWLAIHHPTFIFGERIQFLYQQMMYGTNKTPVSIDVIEHLPARAAEPPQVPQTALPPSIEEDT